MAAHATAQGRPRASRRGLALVAATLHGLTLLTACVVARPAGADPRWWWDDRPVVPGLEEQAWPHLFGGPEAAPRAPVFLVYAERTDGGGPHDLWMTATADGGCSWCPPTRLTETPEDETRPRGALAPVFGTNLAVQVVFERGGDAIVAHDAMTFPAIIPPTQLCMTLAQLGPAIRTGDQFVTLNSVVGTASHPDLAAAARGTDYTHFHAAWRDTRAGGGAADVYVASDLSGAGGTGWGAESLVTGVAPPSDDVGAPAISADTFTMDAARSAVNLAFVDLTSNEVRTLRSVDSAGTWSPVGAPGGSLSSAAASTLEPPALVAADVVSPVQQPTWHLASWFDAAAGNPVLGDAQLTDTPTTAAPPWGADAPLGGPTGAMGVAATLQGTLPSSVVGWITWAGSDAASSELHYRTALLSDVGAPPADFDAFPFPPQRGTDPPAAEDFLLTACAWDEVTGDCTSTRIAGNAVHPTILAAGQFVIAAWTDDRDGAGVIHVKRTDRAVASQSAPALTTNCDETGGAEIHVQWPQLPSCAEDPVSQEHLRRYLVYYGTMSRGPYDNAADPVVVDVVPGAPTLETTLTGLLLGTTYHVVAVPEDEARNLFPSGFDPTETFPFSLPNEASITTPDDCAPDLRVVCSFVVDSCASDAALDADGVAQLGELVELELEISNVGSGPATDYVGLVTAPGADVRAPAGGMVMIPSIPVGESRTVTVRLEVPLGGSLACGDPVDVDLVMQSSDGGAFTFPDEDLPSCDFTVGGEGMPDCRECAAAPSIIVESVVLESDECPDDPTGPGAGNGVADPGETVTFRAIFRNVGDADAIAFTGNVELLAGGVLSAGTAIGPADVAVDATHEHVYTIDLAAGCGDLVDVAFSMLAADPSFAFPDDDASGDFRVGDNLMPDMTSYSDMTFFVFMNGGGPVTSPGMLSPVEEAPVDQVLFRAISNGFNDPDNTVLTLIGPSGEVDVSAAVMDVPVDVTADYNGILGGPGTYSLRAEDTVGEAGGPDSFIREWQLIVTDSIADCVACGAPPECADLVFPGGTTATPVPDCMIELSWEAATGEDLLRYDVYRDGAPIATNLDALSHVDDTVAYGDVHAYRILAHDDCPATGRRELFNVASAEVTAVDDTGAEVASPSATYTGDCAVDVDATITADCAGVALIEILRGTSDPPLTVVGSAVPFTDGVSGNGEWFYAVRVTDEAGHVTTSETVSAIVDGCDFVPETCLHRGSGADRTAFDPLTVFQAPRDADDIAIATPDAGFPVCPVSPGHDDLGAVSTAPPLLFYQVDEPVSSLRVRRVGDDLDIDW